MKKYFVLSLIVFILQHANAQDKLNIQWGKVEARDFILPKSDAIDSNANAVIIADMGLTSFEGNKKGWFNYIFKRKTRIKILKKNGFDAAAVGVFMYNGENTESILKDVSAITYNLENGIISSAKLDTKEIFDEPLTKYVTEKKFTLPAVREGSILEYSYTIVSDDYFRIPAWNFQHAAYPCLWSEYEVKIPSAFNYVFVKQGLHDFSVNQSSVGHQNMMVSEKMSDAGALTAQTNTIYVSVNLNNHRWVIRDVPSLNISMSNYVTSADNYIDKIEFQLSQVYDGAETHDVMNSWAKATSELLSKSYFGTPIRYNREWLDEDLKKICHAATDKTEQAKKIYYYLSANFTCNNKDNWSIRTTLNDTYEKKAGTVGEINLLLIAMLREENIKADPVLLSTREFGRNYAKYPVYSKLNYLICRAVIDGKVYFLDASDPNLGFGQIPDNCYNGHARIISEQDSASIYFIADSLKEQRTTNVIIINDEKGNPSAGLQCTPGQQESYDIRKKIRKIGMQAFFKDIQTSYGSDFIISNTGFDSLGALEESLVYHYDFDFGDIKGNSVFYFNPMLPDRISENPFKAIDRKFPVEMPYTIDEVYTFSMEIPQGFVVDELPKSAKVDLNGKDGLFEYLIQKTDTDIQLKCHLKLSKATFDPAEYNTLRDFYAFVVQKESEQIVFKKK